ncbi:MAG TPA: glucose 1-dehydrogenase [Chloroflexi bacterium]|nr:glucose 1-dehydrogenase [Chloroflexota bacterium]
MTDRFVNRVALVTGGGSGIGEASALAFAREGANVVIADVNIKGGEDVARRIKETGREAIFIQTDVTNPTSVKTMVEESVKAFGRLDFAFNSAGVAPHAGYTVADYPEEEWDRVTGINLKGVFLCLKYELQQMQKQGSGSIVNASSILGLVATGLFSSYVAAKHGVIGLTKAAALENAAIGIRVNAICPGYTQTPLIEFLTDVPEQREYLVSLHPMGRLGIPSEVAETVIWLCSDTASFITGHALAVDGGYVAQ